MKRQKHNMPHADAPSYGTGFIRPSLPMRHNAFTDWFAETNRTPRPRR